MMQDRYPEIILASRFGLLVAAIWLLFFVHMWRTQREFHWMVHFAYLSIATMLFGLSGWVQIARRLDGAFIMLISFGIALVLGPVVTLWMFMEKPYNTDTEVKP